MRILSAVTQSYYGQPHAVEPTFLEFTEPLRGMGHVVEHFDHIKLCREIGPAECGAKFEQQVKAGGYDLVFYHTSGRDHMDRGAIAEASRHAPIVAWNSDDDWQWDSYTSRVAHLFTRMITTYWQVFEANRREFPNLLLSQWGCLDGYSEFSRTKDLNFTFVGQVYRTRVSELRHLRQAVGLRIYGLGALRVSCPPFNNKRIRETVAKWIPATNRALAFPEVESLWNRSKISYTPLGASTNPSMLQIKARVFEMGLSGTLMLAQRCAELERYYKPDKEYVAYDSPEDCIEKVRFYLMREGLRQKMARAYADRTRGEHMWGHRFSQIFRDLGMAQDQVPLAATPRSTARGPIEVAFYGRPERGAGKPSGSR